jgi:SSS family solute:Na+ symporter
MNPQSVDYLIIGVYFLFVIGIDFMLKWKIKTANYFLMSNRRLPLWLTSLAFISAGPGIRTFRRLC